MGRRDEFWWGGIREVFQEEVLVPELGSEDGKVWTVGHEEERHSMPWKQHWQRLQAVPEMQRWYSSRM